MRRADHVEPGRASNLHYGAARSSRAASTRSGAHRGPDGRRTAGGDRRADGSRRDPTLIAGIVALVIVLAVAGAAGWYLMLRDVTFTVNGKEESARIGTSISDVLKAHDYFGVKAGRLMSVGGNVISEDGGNRATVKRDGADVAAKDLAMTKLEGGEKLTVENGADATEPSKEEAVEAAPGIQMQKGGAIQYVSQWGKAGRKLVVKGERSGEVVDKEIIEQPQDMVVASRNPRPAGGKYIALTFDDGPSSFTPQILQVLKDKGVKATFFNLGNESKKQPDLTKQVVANGNELASHTNTHQNLPNLDRDALRGEITSAFDVLKGNAGLDSLQMMRAPYGAFTQVEWARAGDLIGTNVIWNIDTLDWKRPGADAIKNAVLSSARNGSIVLMHDGGGNRSQDVEALPGIIDGLHQAGYTLVTVSELMKLDGNFPPEVVAGTVKMPEGAALPAV